MLSTSSAGLRPGFQSVNSLFLMLIPTLIYSEDLTCLVMSLKFSLQCISFWNIFVYETAFETMGKKRIIKSLAFQGANYWKLQESQATAEGSKASSSAFYVLWH